MTPAELAERNVGLVYAIAGDQWRKLGGEYDDLVGDGMVGLMQAAMRFDRARNDGPFSTYAHKRVVGAMIDGYRQANRTGKTHGKGERRELLTYDGDVADERATPSAEDHVVDQLDLESLLGVLVDMPLPLRDLVADCANGQSHSAIARHAGITPAAINHRMSTVQRWVLHGPPTSGRYAVGVSESAERRRRRLAA